MQGIPQDTPGECEMAPLPNYPSGGPEASFGMPVLNLIPITPSAHPSGSLSSLDAAEKLERHVHR
jgi:hypothetical protein